MDVWQLSLAASLVLIGVWLVQKIGRFVAVSRERATAELAIARAQAELSARKYEIENMEAVKRKELDQYEADRRREFEAEIGEERETLRTLSEQLSAREEAFRKGFVAGRQWLADFIADAELTVDKSCQQRLEMKRHPAFTAAATLHAVAAEKREMKTRLKFLEYQLKSYEEWFPTLVDYRDALLEELIPVGNYRDGLAELENADPALQFMSNPDQGAG